MRSRSLASRHERPLIGVTTSEVRAAERVTPLPEGEPRGKEMALGLPYLRGARGGGRAAGGDAAARRTGDRAAARPPRRDLPLRRARPRPADLRRRAAPRAGPDRARARPLRAGGGAPRRRQRMPILAICRGTQALNIVRGGILHQHLPELSDRDLPPPDDPRQRAQPPGLGRSRQPPRRGARRQRARGRRLADVNSFHHQAIDRLGDGLRISARAPDGTIEAIEDPSRPLPDRRPVARRDARPPPLRGGALPPLRRGLPRRRRRLPRSVAAREVA